MNVITATDVSGLQALSILRWELLLGLPRMAGTVEWELRASARTNRDLGLHLASWVHSCGQPFPLDQHRLRTRRLAHAARRADPLGHLAMAVEQAVVNALRADDEPASEVHLRSLLETSARYLEARNRLVLTGLPLVDAALRKAPLHGDAEQDAFQDGILGLMEALETYEPMSRGTFEEAVRDTIRARVVDLTARPAA
ncbi:MAG: hypothetical protein AAGA54_22360 [Myxococcota bacterium]